MKFFKVTGIDAEEATYELLWSCEDGIWDTPNPPETAITVWNAALNSEFPLQKDIKYSVMDYVCKW